MSARTESTDNARTNNSTQALKPKDVSPPPQKGSRMWWLAIVVLIGAAVAIRQLPVFRQQRSIKSNHIKPTGTARIEFPPSVMDKFSFKGLYLYHFETLAIVS